MFVGWSSVAEWWSALTDLAGGTPDGGLFEVAAPGEAPRVYRLTALPDDPSPRFIVEDRTAARRAQLAVDEATDRSRSLLDAMLAASGERVWAFDTEYRLLAFNELFKVGFESSIGHSPGPGTSLVDLAQTAHERDYWIGLYDAALSGNGVTRHMMPAQIYEEHDLTVEITLSPITLGGEVIGGVAALRDRATMRIQAEGLARANALLDTIARSQSRFIDNPDGDFSGLLTDVLQLTNSAYGFIGEIFHDDDGTPWLQTRAITDISWDAETRALYEANRESGFIFRNLETLFGRVMTTGAPVITNAPSNDPRAGGLPPGHPALEAFIGLPFEVRGRPVGMVGLANRPGGYDADLIRYLRPLLDCCASFVDAIRNQRRRQEAELELVRAKEEAEAANRAKGDFLASMSHEIRTPLNAVLGLAELAQEMADSDDQRELLQAIRNNSDTLMNLITDVLDFSRIDAGLLQIGAAPFDLGRLVEEVAELMAVRAEQAGIEMVVAISPSMPDMVVGDAHRMRQILTNLVSNALKYTLEGEVVLELGGTRLPDGRFEVLLAVSDTGCGINPEHQARIFQRFYRVPETAHLGGGGTGLGLAIVRTLVERMGGEIEVSSTVGHGTTFAMRVPVEVDGDSGRQTGPLPDLSRGLRAALIHPHAKAREAMAQALLAAGIAVEQADSAAQFEERPGAVDVVVSSLAYSGAEPLVRLEPIGHGRRSSDRLRVTLPPRRRALVEAVLTAAGRSSMALEVIGARDDGARRPARLLLVEDHDDTRQAVSHLLRHQGHEVMTARNGGEAASMVRGHDFDLVLMDLHMPEVDGFEAARRIRTDEERGRLRRVPIVAVTAHSTTEVRDRCLANGFDGFLPKPVTGAALANIVTTFGRLGEVVLIIDDAADSRRLLHRYLRASTELRIREAPDGRAGIEAARRWLPSVVLVDALMPGLSGFDTAKALRERLGSAPRLIMVTGQTGVEARRLAEASGCDGFVTKPVHRSQLLAALEAPRPGGSAERASPVAVVDPDILDLIPAFLDDRRADLMTIGAALASDDLKTVVRLGHSMKGSGRAYGMSAVSALGEAIEAAAKAADHGRIEALCAELESFVEQVEVRPAE